MIISVTNTIPSSSKLVESFANTYSLAFDGTNDIIDTGIDNEDVTRTYSFWLKSSKTTENKGVFGCGGARRQLNLNQGGADAVRLYAGWSDYISWSTVPEQDDNAWHHWVVYFDSTDIRNCTLHVDGSLVSGVATGSDGGLTPNTNFHIGSNGAVNYFDGSIDEFAIFTGDETANVSSWYNSGVPKDLSRESNLLAYYRLEEGSGTTATDSSSNSNDGTISGATYQTDVP